MYGPHFWMLDMDLDCSQTEDGWFELQAYESLLSENEGFELDIEQEACTGDAPGAASYTSTYHFAQCGVVNVFAFGEASCATVQL